MQCLQPKLTSTLTSTRMLNSFFRTFLLSLCIACTSAQNGPTGWSASPFSPPAFPLAVRSPYLNFWLTQGGDDMRPLSDHWPRNWNLTFIAGWYMLAVVDETAYRISGGSGSETSVVAAAEQVAVEFTPTRTTFVFNAGGMQINASFLSTIEPLDLVRQSLPFSYLAMSAVSTDGDTHSLRMYTDITGEFITGQTSQLVQWTHFVDDQYVILSMQLETRRKHSEALTFAQDTTEYYAFKKIDGADISWAISNNTIIRPDAANSSRILGNTTQPGPRPVMDSLNWTTLGIAIDWGEVESTPQPAVWALGISRSPSIQYKAGTILEDRYPYFLSSYPDVESALRAFLDDFPRAQSFAESFDSQLREAGQQYSPEYAELLSLTARQVMGSMDITITQSSDGSWNIMDVKAFMKNMGNIGTDILGTSQSVNTVDTLYAAFPAFLYLNPELIGYLLSPLLQVQDSSAYILNYAARNIGTAYPNATADGINNSHDYGVEESANMLIMVLAYTQRSGNGTLLSKHYTLLRGWAEYLDNSTWTQAHQNSIDFISEPDTPRSARINLILKGIIGLACMAKISEIAGVTEDEQRFNKKVISYISQWQDDVFAPDESGDGLIYSDSSGLIYNLYADRLLQLNVVEDSVYDALTSFYSSVASGATYGIPLDRVNSGRTTTQWMMFSASSVTDAATRNLMISQIHNYAASTLHVNPFPSIYNPLTGTRYSATNTGRNSPACGGIFALLALNTTIKSSIDLPSDGSTIPSGGRASNSNASAGAIAGGVVGGVIALVLALLTGYHCCRKRQKHHERFENETKPSPIMLPYEESSYEGSSWVGYSSAGGTTVVSPSQMTSDAPGLSGLLNGANEDRERLRTDVHNLRRELDLLRNDIVEMPPSYSDPGAGFGRPEGRL